MRGICLFGIQDSNEYLGDSGSQSPNRDGIDVIWVAQQNMESELTIKENKSSALRGNHPIDYALQRGGMADQNSRHQGVGRGTRANDACDDGFRMRSC